MDMAEKLKNGCNSRDYLVGWADGYSMAVETISKSGLAAAQPPRAYFDKEAIMERYGGCTEQKAREIIKAVRRWVGGGKLDSVSMVLRSELELWENDVHPDYNERV